MVAVIPATFSDQRLKEVLTLFDTIVLMKVHRVMDRLVTLLDQLQLTESSVLIEQAGTQNEKIIADVRNLTSAPHYFSTMIVRKK